MADVEERWVIIIIKMIIYRQVNWADFWHCSYFTSSKNTFAFFKFPTLLFRNVTDCYNDWVLLPSFLPTPTAGVRLRLTSWSFSLLPDTWHILIDGIWEWDLVLRILYGTRCLAPTASTSRLNVIKILWHTTAEACWLNTQMLEMLNKMFGH